MAKAALARSQAAFGSRADTQAASDSVAILLHRIHVEMIALAEGVLAVQSALSPMFLSHAALSSEGIRETQKLDLIEQTLRALADIATHASVSSEAGPLDIADVTKICRLSDLAERLRGGAPATIGAPSDLELF